MSTAANLVIPIRLSALCTGFEPDATLVGPTASFVEFPIWTADGQDGEPYLSSSVLPFTTSSPTPGIHLHWSLPDALKRGKHDNGTGVVVFPQVPNRWLVTRVSASDPNAGLTIKSWVIESNQELMDDLNQGSPTKPISGTDATGAGQYFLRMGQYFDYDTWEESGCAKPLTAMGYGEPSFAEYYPNCRNVFGFFDDFNQTLDPGKGRDNPNAGPLSEPHTFTYLVVGWYAQADSDPLHGASIDGARNDLGWGFAGESPNATVCSAVLRNVQWFPNKNYIVDTTSELDVAVGNSGSEALAALVASQTNVAADKDAEYLLNAVQKGLFTQLRHDPQRVAKLDLTLHQAQFASEQGGTVWALKPRPAAGLPADVDANPIAAVSATLPPEVVNALQFLNAAQAEYDQACFDIESMRRQVFNDWYRIQLLTNEPQGNTTIPAIDVTAVQTLIEQTIDAIASVNAGLLRYTRQDDTDVPQASGQSNGSDTLATLVVQAYGALLRVISPAKFYIQRVPAAPFWVPSDPVVVLRGQDVAPPAAGGPQQGSRGTYLKCRLSSQLCERWTYAQTTPVDGSGITADARFDKLPSAIARDALALLSEAVGLDPGFADWTARALVAKGAGASATQLAADVAAVCLAARADAAVLEAGALAVSGIAPFGGYGQTWQNNPWRPLFLSWTMNYSPVAGMPPPSGGWSFDPAVVLDNHALDARDIELQLAPGVQPAQQATVTGITPLAKGALANLKTAISDLIKRDPHPDPELEDIGNKLEACPILSQTLGGFHRALNGQFQTLQVDMAIAFTDDPLTDSAAQAVDVFNDAAPISADSSSVQVDWPDLYAPIRTGLAHIGALSLIDSFGQTRQVTPSCQVWADALTTADGRHALPPRLAQPSRLQWRWLRAGQDAVQANDPPLESPICGWVVPDYLDDGLIMFGADGAAIGSLLLIGEPQTVVWRQAPIAGAPVIPTEDHAAQRAHILSSMSDPVLCGFVLGLFDGEPTYLAAVLSAIDRVMSTVFPRQSGQEPAMTTLMGHPLVLTRARIELDMKGLISPDQSWDALLSDSVKPEDGRSGEACDRPAQTRLMAQAGMPVRESRGFAQVELPVRLGDLSQTDDGLVGYCMCAGAADDYARFYSPGATATSGSVIDSDTNPLLLTPSGKPLVVAMLHDPTAAVHATSGILPVKSIQLPSYQYGAAMKCLAVYFYAGPLLMPEAGAPAQLPRVPGFHWVWRHADEGTWRQEPWTGAAGDRAQSSYAPLHLAEGAMALTPDPDATKSRL